MSDLIDCKTCGAAPFRISTIANWVISDGIGYSVECNRCGISVPFPPAPTKEAGDQYWNKYNTKMLNPHHRR